MIIGRTALSENTMSPRLDAHAHNLVSQSPTGKGSDQTTLPQYSDADITITTDMNGEPILPYCVSGFTVRDGYDSAHYTAPLNISRTRIGDHDVQEQQYRHVIVKADGDRFTAFAGDEKKPLYAKFADTVIARNDTELQAVKAAVEWMQSNSPSAPDIIDRPGPCNREPMQSRDIEREAANIRIGSHVEIDALPAVTVTEDVTPENDDSPTTKHHNEYMCETKDGAEVTILVDGSAITPIVTYTPPGDGQEMFRTPSHLSISNEDNLREAVNTELYQYLKSHVGEGMIHVTGDHRFEVVNVEEVRDGYVNPGSGEINPGDRRQSGIHITDNELGKWFAVPPAHTEALTPGSYCVTQDGVIRSDDRYGATVLVEGEVWDRRDITEPVEDAPSTTTEIAFTLPEDRDTLKRHDAVTEVTGIGEVAASQIYHETVGEMYETGWAVPYVSDQYLCAAIADLYTIGDEPDATDAARAVVGMLGGVAFNANGENIGTAASAIAGNLNIEDADYAWITPTTRIKDEYCLTLITDSETRTNAIGAGNITVHDIETGIKAVERLDHETTERFSATAVKASLVNDRMVAVTADGDEPAVVLEKRAVEVAAAIAMIDEVDGRVTVWVTDEDDGEGIIHINGEQWNAVIDTTGWYPSGEVLNQ